MPLNANEAGTRWYANTQTSANTTYKRGIEQCTKNPMQLAADQLPVFLQKVTEAVTSGRMERALRESPMQQWKQNATTTGVMRMGQLGKASESKYVTAMNKFFPHLQAGVDQVHAMPKGTTQAAIARAAFMIQWNADYKNKQ